MSDYVEKMMHIFEEKDGEIKNSKYLAVTHFFKICQEGKIARKERNIFFTMPQQML